MSRKNQPGAHRQVYDIAKANLIKAAIEAAMEEGHDGCSVRKIAERAGVAVGLINYHFSSVRDLMAAAYLDLAFTMLDQAIARAEAHPENPRKQLSAFIEETFGSAVMRRKTLNAWVVFWSMSDTSPEIRDAHDTSNAAFRDFLEALFAKLNRDFHVNPSPRLAAIGLTAIIDGLWLEWCLSPRSFTPKEATCLCEQWIDATLRKNS